MDNSVYITLSRQLALFRDMDATANNLANMNTTGYNSTHMMFSSYLVNDGKGGGMAFTQDISSYENLEQGALRATGNTFDVAIDGDGFFSVSSPLGPRYTRAGNFQLDAEGTLITPEGYAVLDSAGQPIQFTEEDRNIMIGELGNISVNGEERAAFGIVSFDNTQKLEKRGQRMFEAMDTVPQPAVAARVLQGTLEDSNVKPVMEMTHMIEVSRAVGSTAKFIETIYELQRRGSSTWTQQV